MRKSKENPFTQGLFPALDKIFQVRARSQTRAGLIEAAFAVADKGPDVLKDYRDPFGDGPFEYKKTDGGFELASKFKYKDEPVTLRIGPK